MSVRRSRIPARRRIAVLAAIVSGVLLITQDAGAAVTFTVTSAADSGPNTLRQAISDANHTLGPDIIVFNLPPDNQQTGTVTITLLSPLPHITESLNIKGTSQPGHLDAPLIEIRGDKAGKFDQNGDPVDGLFFDAPCGVVDNNGQPLGRVDSRVSGLVINRFSNGAGIHIRGNCTIVVDSYIGTDLTGTLQEANAIGVHIDSRHWPDVSRQIDADNIAFRWLQYVDNTIGSSSAFFRASNVISGNSGAGVLIEGKGSTSNWITGNFIGTDVTGTTVLANGHKTFDGGIIIRDGSSDNQIGENSPGPGVISGNIGNGITISHSSGNHIINTVIGTDQSHTRHIQNLGDGVHIDGPEINWVGWGPSDYGNVIYNNVGAGIATEWAGHTFLSNEISGNQKGLGIDIYDNGVTPDGAPVLTNALTGLFGFNRLVSVSASLSGVQGNTMYDIQFFATSACDPAGAGEGTVYVGNMWVMTDGGGSATFNATSNLGNITHEVLPGQYLTATATRLEHDWPQWNPHESSEFSKCAKVNPLVTPAPPAILVPKWANLNLHGTAAFAPGAAAGVTYTLTATNEGPNHALFVSIAQSLPPSLHVVSCTASNGTPCSGVNGDSAAGFVDIAPGASETMTVFATFNAVATGGGDGPGVIAIAPASDTPSAPLIASVTASVGSFSTPDPDPTNNSVTLVVASDGSDVQPPDIRHAEAHPDSLWPPNGRLHDVGVFYHVTDNVDAPSDIACSLSVSGAGVTPADWEVLDAHHVRLRATHRGDEGPRVYTVGISCEDRAGNVGTRSIDVKTAHR